MGSHLARGVAHAGSRIIGLDGVLTQQENYREIRLRSRPPEYTLRGSADGPAGLAGVVPRGLVSLADIPFAAIEADDATVFPAPRRPSCAPGSTRGDTSDARSSATAGWLPGRDPSMSRRPTRSGRWSPTIGGRRSRARGSHRLYRWRRSVPGCRRAQPRRGGARAGVRARADLRDRTDVYRRDWSSRADPEFSASRPSSLDEASGALDRRSTERCLFGPTNRSHKWNRADRPEASFRGAHLREPGIQTASPTTSQPGFRVRAKEGTRPGMTTRINRAVPRMPPCSIPPRCDQAPWRPAPWRSGRGRGSGRCRGRTCRRAW